MAHPLDLARVAVWSLGVLAPLAPAAAQLQTPWPIAIALPGDEAEARALALQALVASGSPGDLARLVDGLADPAPLVADTAQLACSALRTTRAVAGLLGPSGLQHPRADVRLRAAEALGRTGAVYRAEDIGALLPRRDNAECRALLESLERLAQARLLTGDVDGAAQWIQTWIRGKNDDEMRARAFATVAAMSASRGARHTTTVLRQNPPPMLHAAALEHAIRAGLVDASAAMEKGLSSPLPRMRAHLIDLVAWRGDREALVWLVDLLEREERLGLRWRAAERLAYLTSERHGLDAAAWRRAVQALPFDWVAARNRSAVAPGTLTELSLEGLAAFEPRSDRLALVIHLAAPPAAEAAPGWRTTRRERVTGRLRAASKPPVSNGDIAVALEGVLRQVVAGARLGLFAGQPRERDAWPTLTSFEPADVAAARTAVEAAAASDLPGDLYGALTAALADPEVDRVLLVTRGGPCVGQHVVPDLLVERALSSNRFRHVVFDVVLVEPSAESLEPLRRLAAETHGRFVQVGAARPSRPR